MLIYHPAYDAYHCAFRILALSEHIKELELDKARILDFYLLFPASIAQIRLPNTLKGIRKTAQSLASVYHDPISPQVTFRDMQQIQETAVRCIAASGLIDVDSLEAGRLLRTETPTPVDLKAKTSEFLLQREPISNFVLRQLAEIPLRGEDGLKHRTELMEYRYDIV